MLKICVYIFSLLLYYCYFIIYLQSFASVMSDASMITRMGVNLLIRQTKSQPFIKQTAKEFMFGYESALVTIGNKFLPSWIVFDKLGLIDRVSFNTSFNTFLHLSKLFNGELNIRIIPLILNIN